MLMIFAIAALVAGALVLLPSLIAPRRPTPVKAQAFECGKDPIGIAEGRFAIKFSTIAIFFILVDIELVFVWPCVFLSILMLGFAYMWRKGGLEWE
ncbi:MAG: NADH-quinone oxidoreductase subunit A [Candidatus Rokuibacteriota bacterium]|nr:MAG: NADH-quinone oxidoreductase subunit A [Candidatus Rokubacteria bacterium]